MKFACDVRAWRGIGPGTAWISIPFRGHSWCRLDAMRVRRSGRRGEL